jgi:hypothetical protein
MASDDNSPHLPGRFPTWQQAYDAVLGDVDTNTLFKLVEVAQAAILTRRAELEGSSNHHSERQAIEKALANLQVVKKERLKFLSGEMW